jgi:hypothetical protein
VSAVALDTNDLIATLSFQHLSLQNVLIDRIPSPVSGVNGVTYSLKDGEVIVVDPGFRRKIGEATFF